MKQLAAIVLLTAVGCSTLTLVPADFSWPVESELTADNAGMVKEDRYHMAFNVKPLMFDELQDSVNISGKTFRVIRDRSGNYFVTGPKFKHVYVFVHGNAGLEQTNKIMINEAGMANPAFNQRIPYIQLINGREKPVLLTRDGIQEQPK